MKLKSCFLLISSPPPLPPSPSPSLHISHLSISSYLHISLCLSLRFSLTSCVHSLSTKKCLNCGKLVCRKCFENIPISLPGLKTAVEVCKLCHHKYVVQKKRSL